MTREQIKRGVIVNHVKHNRHYMIMEPYHKHKDTVKGWVVSVVYAPMYPNECPSFSREIESFLEEFELV